MKPTRKPRQCAWHTLDGEPCERMTTMATNEFGGIPACRDHIGHMLATISAEVDDAMLEADRELRESRHLIAEEALREHMESDGCDVVRYQDEIEHDLSVVESRRPPNYIYYMRCGDYVKIGRSHTPVARWRTIRNLGGVRAPEGLDLTTVTLDRVEVAGVEMERFRHDQFSHLRVAGEWFEYGPEIEKLMQAKDRPATHFPRLSA